MHRTRIVSFLQPLTLAVALTALPTAALAGASTASDLSYTYVRVEYGKGEVEDVDTDNYDLTASLAVAGYMYLNASYAHTEINVELESANVDAQVLELGVGVNLPISDSADVIAEIAYLDAKYSIDNRVQGVGISGSESGYGLTLGVRAIASEQLQLGIAVQSADMGDESETGWTISADYFVSEALSPGVGFAKSSDSDAISVNARYSFLATMACKVDHFAGSAASLQTSYPHIQTTEEMFFLRVENIRLHSKDNATIIST